MDNINACPLSDPFDRGSLNLGIINVRVLTIVRAVSGYSKGFHPSWENVHKHWQILMPNMRRPHLCEIDFWFLTTPSHEWWRLIFLWLACVQKRHLEASCHLSEMQNLIPGINNSVILVGLNWVVSCSWCTKRCPRASRGIILESGKICHPVGSYFACREQALFSSYWE